MYQITEDDIIDIPLDKLQEKVLFGIVDEFILQEGTDYGQEEYSLEEKREQVIRQIKEGKARIIFNQKTESCLIVPDRRKFI